MVELINCKVCWKIMKKLTKIHDTCFDCLHKKNTELENILIEQAERNKLLVQSRCYEKEINKG
jgi:hypothetical protein